MNNPLPAQITQIKTMSKFVRLTVDTQETLTPEQKSELFDLYESVGYFFFLKQATVTIKTDELPEIHLDQDAGEKSPSQRLRAVLFIYWKQKGSKDDFELFYRRWMERCIDQIKQQLL